jgi:hypothetical protein
MDEFVIYGCLLCARGELRQRGTRVNASIRQSENYVSCALESAFLQTGYSVSLSRSEYSFFSDIFAVRDAESAKEAARARRLRPGRAQPRAMKFGHRFQQVIEQTHPSVSDQVRSRAARVTPRGCRNSHALALYRSRSVRAARRVRPSRVSRRARARASPRAVTRRGAPTPHPPGRRLAAPEPGRPRR